MNDRDLVRRFDGLKVGVLGDLMADHLLHGTPTRLSREAPVVVLRHEREFYLPGGAANCAANLISLGAKVSIFGVVGRDAAGDFLKTSFRKRGADVRGILSEPQSRTITKTRILAGDPHRTKQQIVRIDREPPPLSGAIAARLAARAAAVRGLDAWLLADYGYGAVTAAALTRTRARIRVGTSRYDMNRLKGLTAVTANEAEALEATGLDDPLAAGRRLFRSLRPLTLLVTRGREGMICFSGGKADALEASGSRDAVDVTGAGDTVSAVMTLALAAGADPREAARLANAAAGEVVMRPGAATLTPRELLEAAGR